MRLYHNTNSPHRVLPVADSEYDDDELVLTRSSTHSREYDILLRIDLPDGEMNRLTKRDKKTWTTTNAELRLAGAEVDCATDDDRARVGVYLLAAKRDAKLDTIASLRRYVARGGGPARGVPFHDDAAGAPGPSRRSRDRPSQRAPADMGSRHLGGARRSESPRLSGRAGPAASASAP